MLIIKVGGGKGVNWDYIVEDLVRVIKKKKVIIVHGANAKRDEVAAKLGHPTKVITSPSGVQSVFTDEKAIEIFLMVYSGLVNKQLVAKLQSSAINAVGLSGVDGKLWEGQRKKSILAKDGNKTKLVANSLTGKVEKINTKLLKLLIDNGFVPVICPPAISYEGEIINSDTDWAIAMMSKILTIDEIIFLFEAPGMMRDLENKKTLIKKIKRNEIDKLMRFARGRMKKKMIAVKYALNYGVKKIYFGDGRIKNPISSAFAGRGTVIS